MRWLPQSVDIMHTRRSQTKDREKGKKLVHKYILNKIQKKKKKKKKRYILQRLGTLYPCHFHTGLSVLIGKPGSRRLLAEWIE